jgi:hypothetical protein
VIPIPIQEVREPARGFLQIPVKSDEIMGNPGGSPPAHQELEKRLYSAGGEEAESISKARVFGIPMASCISTQFLEEPFKPEGFHEIGEIGEEVEVISP